jgi:gamma-glutamylcyclotransferase (GGCT)/AIG2-like uncharacterized protein YtfP
MNFRNVQFMFAYGMNTNLTSMLLRCRSARVIGNAILSDFRLAFRYHLDIEESKFDMVEGVLWELSPGDLDTMDQVEGYPEYYTRSILTPYVGYYGNVYPAWTYYMQDKSALSEPSPSYWELVNEGYRQNNIPPNQLEEALDRVYVELQELQNGN